MKTIGVGLKERMEHVVRIGEVPYQANRRAARAFDIYRDDSEGKKELLVMLEGLDIFILDLEGFGHEAEAVAKQALAAVR